MIKTAHGSAARTDDEPKTPLWLPALGLAFFVALAVLLATLPEQAAGSAASTAPPTSGAKAPAAPSPPPVHS